MLFADCRGYTAMTHEKGPMFVRDLMDEFFRSCTDVLLEHDAIVDRFAGDAVMAFFNVPIRHDDHIGRAVAAATQIQLALLNLTSRAALGQPLGVGIGLDTGLTYVGTVGSDDPKDYTVIGDAVNIAARLQGQAAPGEILVTEMIYEEVQHAFPHAQQRVVELKGIKEPVRAYALT